MLRLPSHFISPLSRRTTVRGWTCRRGILTLSHATGPTSTPLLNMTIPEHFSGVVREFGDRTAVVSCHQNIRLTYGDLDRRSDEFGLGMRRRGVRKGDRVAVSLGNNIEYAIATYGLFKIGAILVPLNPSFTAPQIISAMAHLQASHLVIGTETRLPKRQPRENVSLLQKIVPNLQNSKLEAPEVPSLQEVILVDNSDGQVDASSLRAARTWQDVLEDGASTSRALLGGPSLDANDVVNIQFTSGTTSAPKAACLTHKSILNNGFSIGNRMLLTSEDIICCPPPLFHCFGSILGYMASATHGSCIVFPSEAFNPNATLKAVQEERCTALYGVPTMFISELELIQSGQISATGFEYLRTGIAAGSSIPAELMRKLHKTLNLTELTICYGMTETSPVSAMTTTDDPIEKRINTVGQPLDHVECKVVDLQNPSRTLPIGQRGELAVSGYLVMQGYWHDPARTAEVMLQDDIGKVWMHTGDEAVMDEEGYIAITGRIKDIIIRGGENIHPLEVENCLLAHPDVQEVAVVGAPDEKYGEIVVAFVTVKPTTNASVDDLQIWVGDRLAFHLVPKHVFWTEEYPKTASGKIQKFKLRERAIELIKQIST